MIARVVAAVLLLQGGGLVAALAQGVGCELDCWLPQGDGPLGALLQGTAYSAPIVLLLAIAAAGAVASRGGRMARAARVGLALAGGVMAVATWGEPWVQRALARPGPMTLVALLYFAAALLLVVAGAAPTLAAMRRRRSRWPRFRDAREREVFLQDTLLERRPFPHEPEVRSSGRP